MANIKEIYMQTMEPDEQKRILLVSDDLVMQRLVLVWDRVPKESATGEWHNCHFSLSDWCILAGVPDSLLNIGKCNMLLNMHIVFPDGKLHYWVDKWLMARASSLVARRKKTSLLEEGDVVPEKGENQQPAPKPIKKSIKKTGRKAHV